MTTTFVPHDIGYEWRRELLLELADDPPPALRCEACGYLATAIGHKVSCDG